MSASGSSAPLRTRMLAVCDAKIKSWGPQVGLSFYAFFVHKNDAPELLMEMATGWIRTHRLKHFEKAEKIRQWVQLP